MNLKLLFVLIVHLSFGIGIVVSNKVDRITQYVVFGILLAAWAAYIRKYISLAPTHRKQLSNSAFNVTMFAVVIFIIGILWLKHTN